MVFDRGVRTIFGALYRAMIPCTLAYLSRDTRCIYLFVTGLGIMGDGMARNLIKGGRDVVVWNRTGSKAVDFSKQTGCETAGTPREVGVYTISTPDKNLMK